MAWQQSDSDEEYEIFEHNYFCFPVSCIGKENLENGDKIIMPPSALNSLASMQIEYPMLFELKNSYDERVTHCGVMEFIADEGVIYIPNWMMENLRLQEGDIVILRNICLPKGSFVKMQPHTKDFLDLYNPRAMLETSLRSYSCLTTGDTIVIPYNNKKYYFDVLETKPYSAISIIETDCEVDFAQPLDYTEPEKQLPSVEKESPEVEDELTTKKVQLIPFSGCGRRKPSTQSAEQVSSSKLKQQQTEHENSKPTNTRSRRTSGKLVFGSNANTPKIQTPPKASPESTSEESSQKAEEPKFKAFTGKKYSLMS